MLDLSQDFLLPWLLKTSDGSRFVQLVVSLAKFNNLHEVPFSVLLNRHQKCSMADIVLFVIYAVFIDSELISQPFVI